MLSVVMLNVVAPTKLFMAIILKFHIKLRGAAEKVYTVHALVM